MRPKEVKEDMSLFLIESAVIGYRQMRTYIFLCQQKDTASNQFVGILKSFLHQDQKDLCLNVLKLILSLLVIPSSRNQIFYSNTSLLLSPYLKL